MSQRSCLHSFLRVFQKNGPSFSCLFGWTATTAGPLTPSSSWSALTLEDLVSSGHSNRLTLRMEALALIVKVYPNAAVFLSLLFFTSTSTPPTPPICDCLLLTAHVKKGSRFRAGSEIWAQQIKSSHEVRPGFSCVPTKDPLKRIGTHFFLPLGGQRTEL